MSLPLIGITTARTPNKAGNPTIMVMEAYVKALASAGAAPLLIPLGLENPALQAVASRLNGILFTGGGDIHPQHFGGDHHRTVDLVDEERDRVEMHLYYLAVEKSLPFLGICRGLQLVNVAQGGSLYTHIIDQHPAALKHDYMPDWPRTHLAHPVCIDGSSLLAGILGMSETDVNSLHHQGIRDLAPGLRAIAHAPDGLVEAVELAEHPFGMAVQWHPEWLQAHEPMRNLFSAFVEAAGRKV